MREPDAVVQCNVATDLDSTILRHRSLSWRSLPSERDDTGDKLVESLFRAFATT
jgi:hypothetical protein